MMVKGWSSQLSISSVNKQRKLSPKGRMDLDQIGKQLPFGLGYCGGRGVWASLCLEIRYQRAKPCFLYSDGKEAREAGRRPNARRINPAMAYHCFLKASSIFTETQDTGRQMFLPWQTPSLRLRVLHSQSGVIKHQALQFLLYLLLSASKIPNAYSCKATESPHIFITPKITDSFMLCAAICTWA